MILTSLLALGVGIVSPPDTTPKQPLVAMFSVGAFEVEPVWWGSSPWFVLYQDGTIIYRTVDENDSVAYLTVDLPPSATAALIDSLRLTPDFFLLRDHYNNVPAVSDQNTFILWAWNGDSAKKVMLTGVLDTTSIFARIDSALYRAQTPRVFLDAYLRLAAFRHPDARPWSPINFEIVLIDFPYAANRTAWPSGWPTLESPGSYMDHRGYYHIALKPSQAQDFLTHYGRDARSTGFTLAGKVWVGLLRPLLPGDRLWNP